MSQGKQVSQEEHLLLLERMNNFNNVRTKVYLKNATAEQVLKHLKDFDEVIVKTQKGTTVRIRQNAIYMNGIPVASINPTSTEAGATYEQGIHKSNNFTGEQIFMKILEKYLD